MTIIKRKDRNLFTIEGLTFGKLLRLQKALELDQKETGSTLGGEMLSILTQVINDCNATPINTNLNQ